MNIEVARQMVRQSFSAARSLQEALQFLKENCDAKEYETYVFDVAKAIDGVSMALLNKALKAHPELEREVDQKLATDGRYL